MQAVSVLPPATGVEVRIGPITLSQIGLRAVPSEVRRPTSKSPPPPETGAVATTAGSTPDMIMLMMPPSELPHCM